MSGLDIEQNNFLISEVDARFQFSKSFKIFFYLNNEQDSIIKAGVGVSSRNFKKAVERNRIKRLLREAYRTEKQPLHEYLNKDKKQLALFLLFIDKELPQYNPLKEKMKLGIQKLIHQLNEVDIKNT